MLVRICTRGPCLTPRVSITLMRYIPGRGRAKVRVCISRKDANEPGPRETVGRQKSIASAECVQRTHSAHIQADT